jgi:hypothetical protein
MNFKGVYKDCISKAMIENDSQLSFYKVLFSYFQRICSQTLIHILCMQASPPCFVHKTLLENSTCFENWFDYWLKTLL